VTGLKAAFYSLVARGRYADALVKIESLLASDPTNPAYDKLQGRLRRITAVSPDKISGSRAWNAAAAGLTAWISEKEDPAFAYDALRYARELAPRERMLKDLAPSDRIFEKLLLEEEEPRQTRGHQAGQRGHPLSTRKARATSTIPSIIWPAASWRACCASSRKTVSPQAGGLRLPQLGLQKARAAWQKAVARAEDEQMKEYLAALESRAGRSFRSPRPARKKRVRLTSLRFIHAALLAKSKVGGRLPRTRSCHRRQLSK
jgi:hypothetical protein